MDDILCVLLHLNLDFEEAECQIRNVVFVSYATEVFTERIMNNAGTCAATARQAMIFVASV